MKKVFFCPFFVFNGDSTNGGVAVLDKQGNYR